MHTNYHRRFDIKRLPKKQFFDSNYFKKIERMKNKDINLVIKMYEDYLIKFPYDYYTYTLYASSLIKVNRIDEAEKVLDYADKLYNKKKYDDKEKEKKYKATSTFSRIKVLCYKEEYGKILDLIRENRIALRENKYKISTMIEYCRKQLGLEPLEGNEEDHYAHDQIKNYDEESALEHVQKHMIISGKDIDSTTTSFFNEDFPLEKIIEEIKKLVPNDTKTCTGLYDHHYYFKYDECGRCIKEKDRTNFAVGIEEENKAWRAKLKTTDYFKVVVLKDTKNIITICPCETPKGFQYTDLNYLKEKDVPKVLRRSNLDKFKEKYKNY